MPIRVVIVDDHVIFRDGLRILLERNGVSVVGEADNGAEGVELVRGCRPQLVIMDLNMPVMNGIEAASEYSTGSGNTDHTADGAHGRGEYSACC